MPHNITTQEVSTDLRQPCVCTTTQFPFVPLNMTFKEVNIEGVTLPSG